MNLLNLVQEFCVRSGLERPALVTTSQDDQLLQIVGLANEVLSDCLDGYNWQVLTEEAVFPSVNGQSQGRLSDLAPGFRRMLSETIYDRTRRLPIWGPNDASKWQSMEALPFSGPYYQFRLRGDELLFFPDMEEGSTLAFEYFSSRAVQGLDGERKTHFSQDTDICLLPPHLILLGLRWKWKEEKGLPYAENRLLWNKALASARAADKGAGTLSLNARSADLAPGIFVPDGNWKLP